jgi:uncharacterized spore protein YtfJ
MDLSTSTEELVRTVAGMPQELGASACFGTPVEREGHTLIPAARVSFGYGLGFGGGSGSSANPSENGSSGLEGGEGGGGGGGGGGSSTPVAVIEITRDGVQIQPIRDHTRIELAGITFAAWAAFWLFWTIRAVVRQRAKVRQLEIKSAAG